MTNSLFNILAICGAAGFSGVMHCIGVTLGGYWRSLQSQEFLDWFAANGDFVSKTIPLIVLPTLIGLIGSLWMSWSSPSFTLWIASALCMGVVLVLTFAYFVPSNTAFATGDVDPSQVAAKLNQWVSIHYARIGLAMLSAALGVVAVAK